MAVGRLSSDGVLAELLKEDRHFRPSAAFRDQALIQDDSIYEQAAADPERFWEREAERLHWFRRWDRALDWKPPHARWFVHGTLNAAYNCLDHQLALGRRNKAAIIWEGEPGERRTLTYWELSREVNRFANVLKKLGVQRGDRVAIYMPMVPELPIAMLACARVGAVHSVVFGGFSAEALRDRINDCGAKVLITADGGYRRGGLLPLKHDADYALREAPLIEHVIVVRRGNFPLRMKEGRDHWYQDLVAEASAECPAEEMDAEDPLFVLYTSGTTGKPKGVVHTTGGYLTGVHSSMRYVFDLKEEDVYWCTADIGWVTGHSYIVYGPLSAGATVMMYEGAPDWPDRDRFWRLIESYGVTIFYTAPTAIRAFMKWGTQHLQSRDLSTLRLLGTVGEPINPEAWMWYYDNVGQRRCPVVDTWWQTETGMILITTIPGVSDMRPGHAGRAVPGTEAKVLNDKGEEVSGAGGYLALTRPWPAMLRGIYGDPERYVQQYWSKWDPATYFAGDGARLEEDYFLLLGRVDDVLSVAGHRIGTMEVESALVDHPSVAEAAVVGVPHEIKGQAICAFVTVKENTHASRELERDLKEHVVRKIGAIARPDQIIFSADLPKTRSGKIMRRLLRDIAVGEVLGDTTTLADASVIDNLKRQYEEKDA